ncbi:protein of unknown function [Hyphomicrobium sp. MC1]|nr:protein of unknown function [Hyphomicrobium sp. MC1]
MKKVAGRAFKVRTIPRYPNGASMQLFMSAGEHAAGRREGTPWRSSRSVTFSQGDE